MPIITTQFPAQINVANLNGANGFAITEFPANSQGGVSVAIVGDINDDGVDDLALGAPIASSSTGAGYVIFGKSGIGNTGNLSVSSLIGSNGFTITGFPSSSAGGSFVTAVGDINNDGITDLAISAPWASNYAGIVYIIFGKSGIGSSGILDVSILDGTDGFAINGFPSGGKSGSGTSVSGAGDINGDGIADLIIGAPYAFNVQGASYVIFGSPQIGHGGTLTISSLTGSNGFSITGFPAKSAGGYSVSGAGDINGDHIADFLLSASVGMNQKSPCFIIFGQSDIGSSGSFNVSRLTGTNGFVVTGFTTTDDSSTTVSGAGDINADGIADFIVGMFNVGLRGASFVIFGKSGIGRSGIINVSNLTGSDGFDFTGFTANSGTAFSVIGTKDINDDGISDLLIGAPTAAGGAGLAYIIFGKPNIGNKGEFSVASLTGKDGTLLTGFPGSSNGGWSVSGAGDVNADGVTDLIIGAPFASNNKGSSFVVFGDVTAALTMNRLTITEAQIVTLTSNNLNATNLKYFQRNPQLIFTASNIVRGNFFLVTDSSKAITTFTQQQIYNGQIQFAKDDSEPAPSYSISLSTTVGYAATLPQPAAITYIHLGPRLVNNLLAINQGQALVLSSMQLSAIDQDNPADNPSLVFTISNVAHGIFEYVSNPSIAITYFVQNQISSSTVRFVHDGTTTAPSYQVSVSDGAVTTPSQPATVIFNLPPVLINNTLSISQGQTLVFTSVNLSATDPDDSAPSLTFIISNTQHGHFEFVNSPGTVITSFIQGQIQNKNVQFIHDGTTNPPAYDVSVSDGKVATTPRASTVHFNIAPILVNNNLSIKQAERVILTSNNLSAVDPDETPSSLLFIISDAKYGHFELISNPGIVVTSFTQGQVQMGNVRFVQDGSGNPPSYNVAVSDGKITISPQASTITFNATPVLVNNHLNIMQGQSVILTSGDLSAFDRETSPGLLLFISSAIYHGHFEDRTVPGISIIRFAQQKIIDGTIKFFSDGSNNPPSYNISVSDGDLSSSPAPAIINFSLTQETAGTTNSIQNAIIGGVVSGVVGLGFFVLRAYLARKATKSLQRILEGGQTEAQQRLLKFQKEVIAPVADKVFAHIKTTNLIGYRSDKNTKAYIAAIEILLGRLSDLGVNLNLESMQLAQQNRLFTEIAKQTRLQLVPHHGCCSCATITSFFKPEVTPAQIEENVEVIAAAIQAALRSQAPNAKVTQRITAEPTELSEIKTAKLN